MSVGTALVVGLARRGIEPVEDVVHLTAAELDRLLEYSASLPTGTTIGKRWRRNVNAYRCATCDEHTFGHGRGECRVFAALPPEWWIGEYVEDPDPKFVGIRWTRVRVVP